MHSQSAQMRAGVGTELTLRLPRQTFSRILNRSEGCDMVIQLTPDQERVIGRAIEAGLIRTADEVVGVGVDAIQRRLDERPLSDRTTRPIEEIIRDLAAEVPQAEWDRLPRDLTDNLDHYLYGTLKP